MEFKSLEQLDRFAKSVGRKARDPIHKQVASDMGDVVGLLQDQQTVQTALVNIKRIEANAIKRGEDVSSGKVYEAKKSTLDALNKIESALRVLLIQVFPESETVALK